MVDENIGATVFDAIRTMLPDTQAQVRFSGDSQDPLTGTVDEAMCTGIEDFRDGTEEGRTNSKEGNVRYKLSDEPDAWGKKVDEDDQTPGTGRTEPAIMGQQVDVLLPGYSDWDDAIRCRVMNRLVMAGHVRLSVQALFEES